ncbi:MAG: hypothetical protein JWO38_4178, partial [Gemmataceae bacterium]|nr:hypothetical protein [Gemmataceae bacterium]
MSTAIPVSPGDHLPAAPGPADVRGAPSPPTGDDDTLPIGGPIAIALLGLGDWSLFAARAITGAATRAFGGQELLRVAVEVGVGSLSVV